MADKKAPAKKTTSAADRAEKKTTTARKTTAAVEKKPTAAKATAKKTTAAKAMVAVAPKPAAAPMKRARPLRRAPAAAQAEGQPYSWRRSKRRTRVGLVSSAKQPHTVTVVVERMREHPLYKKVVRLRKKYAAHDAAGDVRAGDLVRIQESRPFSATKHWQVVEVLSRAGEAGAAAPRVADVEKLLEQAEGADTILAPHREEKAEAEPETAE